MRAAARSSFHVSKHGALTFGGPLAYRYDDAANRFDTVAEIATKFVTDPTISPLFKPGYGGITGQRDPLARQLVSHQPDRVAVTWFASEPHFYTAFAPEAPDRFQAVLSADGVVRFHYGAVASGDGVVGLFSAQEATKGALIASIPDPRNPELAGYLDLLDAAIYESSTDGLIVEWTTRGRIPEPLGETRYSYRLHLDTDKPYFDGRDDDLDFVWQVDLEADASRTRGGRRLPIPDGNRIAMLVEDPAGFGITAGVRAGTAQFDNGRGVAGDESFSEVLELPQARPLTDLSRPGGSASDRQSEVFHYRSAPDTVKIACRVIDVLGDVFDMFMFHNEFRIDSQENSTPSGPYYGPRPQGIGFDDRRVRPTPCGDGRLKKPLTLPVLSQNLMEDLGINFLTHEFVHRTTASIGAGISTAPRPSRGPAARRVPLWADPFGTITPTAH